MASKWKAAGTKISLVSTAAAKVKKRRDEVNAKFAEISKAMDSRGKQLKAALENAQFNEKAEKFESAIEELLKEASDESFAALDPQTANFDRRIKSHKEFEDELSAQDLVKKDLMTHADALIKEGHFASDAISARKDGISTQWEALVDRSALKRQHLLECHEFAVFSRDVDETLVWIENNKAVAGNEDTGDDLDGAKGLQRNFEEFKATLEVNRQSRVTRVTEEAMRLISGGHPNRETIATKERTISEAWLGLTGVVQERDEALDSALLIHEFNRDVEEAVARIAEKAAPLSADLGDASDLSAVENLKRAHEALVIQTRSLEDEVSRLADEGTQLAATFPAKVEALKGKQTQLNDAWTDLQNQTASRSARLESLLADRKFVASVRAYEAWAQKITELMKAENPSEACDVAAADLLLQRHSESKGKIEAEFGKIDQDPTTVTSDSGGNSNRKYDELNRFGSELVANGHPELGPVLKTLVEQKKCVAELWNDRNKVFIERREELLFTRNVSRVDAWISKQLAFLDTNDVGDSLASVDKLLRKHENFEKSLIAQQEKMKELQGLFDELKAKGHGQTVALQSQLEKSQKLRAELCSVSESRQKKLAASERLQRFLRDAKELDDWIGEKAKACNDNFALKSTLRVKIQWQQNFLSELETNESRFADIRSAASALLDEQHFAADVVRSRLSEVDQSWTSLLNVAKEKEKLLAEAEQVQALRMKSGDMEHWCNTTLAKLKSEDFGDSLQRIDNLMKNHILLEVDIKEYHKRVDAVKSEGQALIDAGNHLATEVQQLIAQLSAQYAGLDEPRAHRHAMLDLSLHLYQYYRNVDVEIKWTQAKISEIDADTLGDSVTGVQRKQKAHANLQSEVATRQKAVTSTIQTSKDLTSKPGYSERQLATVEERQLELSKAWAELVAKADQRHTQLVDAFEVQQYLADAAEATALLNKKLMVVSNTDYGSGEDSVSLLNKHNTEVQNLKTFNNTIVQLQTRSASCKESGLDTTVTVATSASQASVPQPAKPTVRAKYAYPGPGREKKAKELAVSKGEVLIVLKNTDKDWWKVQRLDGQESGYVPANYVTLLPTESVPTISSSPSGPTGGSGPPQSVSSTQTAVEELYDGCLREAEVRRQMLDESIKMHKLKTLRDAVDGWISECEESVKVLSPGTDLEHNELLQKQFDNFLTDLKNNERRLIEVRELGEGFIAAGHTQANEIATSLDTLNARWEDLFELTAVKEAYLSDAHELHKINRDVDEVNARFAEKETLVSSEDFGADLSSVEALQRKFDLMSRDMKGALAAKVDQVIAESNRLASSQPDQAASVHEKREMIETKWQKLQECAESRKKRLEESRAFQLFLKDFRDISSWIGGVIAQASSTELAKSQSAADEMLKRHLELEGEVSTRSRDVDELRAAGVVLLSAERHYAKETQAQLDEVEGGLVALQDAMAARKAKLVQCVDLQRFNRMADQVEMWISTQETPLRSTDYGTTLDSVESLQKNHLDLEKSLVAQENQVDEVVKEAQHLISGEHYDATEIAERKDDVVTRWSALRTAAENRKSKLDEALQYQQYLRETDEVEAWMNEKMHTASDPSYQDPSNLQGKVQKHSKFEAEVAANEARVFTVVAAGNGLIEDGKGDISIIKERNVALQALWEDLNSASTTKSLKLGEARQQQQYNLSVEDVELWLSTVERLANSSDLGKDLLSVQSLIKKHKALVSDIAEHKGAVEKLVTQAADFAAAGHFDAATISQRCSTISDRYTAVSIVATNRTHDLTESEKLHKLLRDVDDEESWIREKQRVASSTDFGRDLTSVQSLAKKHVAFGDEMDAHKVFVEKVLAEAQTLFDNDHFDRESVTTARQSLSNAWNELQSQSELRKQQLRQEIDAQEFIAKVTDEQSWISEKHSLLEQTALPDTLSSAEALTRKHGVLELDCKGHRSRVAALGSQASSLVSAKNRSASAILTSAEMVRVQMEELDAAVVQRTAELYNITGFLQVSRDADSILAWIESKKAQATSDEYGEDLAEVEELTTKHETLQSSLTAFGEKRVADFAKLKDGLIKEGNTNGLDIEARYNVVMDRWEQLMSASQERNHHLLAAFRKFEEIDSLLLEFAKKASEFNMWFENAEEDLSDPVHNQLNSLDEIAIEKAKFQDFLREYNQEKVKFADVVMLSKKISTLQGPDSLIKNPYTWFNVEALERFWESLDAVIADRKDDLDREQVRQEGNEKLRVAFANQANDFARFLSTTRTKMTEGSGTLEMQLEATKKFHELTVKKKVALEEIERIGAEMENLLILDNKHTEFSTVQLAQLWDQLEQLGTRMEYNLEQQIEQKNASGVSDDRLQEIVEIFRTFDADGSGELDRNEVKSCLRASGMNLPLVEEGEPEPEFEAVLAQMDPDGSGKVDLAEFKAYMISKETTNVESSQDVGNAFAQAANSKPYITKAELYSALDEAQAEYCIRNMKPYIDDKGIEVGGAYDYLGFVNILFAS